eukprot:2281551-Prymnesium_polylepis.1
MEHCHMGNPFVASARPVASRSHRASSTPIECSSTFTSVNMRPNLRNRWSHMQTLVGVIGPRMIQLSAHPTLPPASKSSQRVSTMRVSTVDQCDASKGSLKKCVCSSSEMLNGSGRPRKPDVATLLLPATSTGGARAAKAAFERSLAASVHC